MRRLSGIIGVCVAAGVLGSVVGPASALINNGFDTDHYFTAATYRPSYYGRIKQFEESTGDEWPTQPEFTPWNKYMSLTFAGTGSNDARMFVLAPNDWQDPRILEFRYDTATHEGVQVQSKLASEIMGAAWTPITGETWATNIRYNPVRNSLVFGVHDVGITDAARAYEIGLDLTYKGTYVGPQLSGEAGVSVAVNWNTGATYLMAKGLNSAANKGDVVGFNAPGSSWSTVIDSDALGDAGYVDPEALIFRKGVAGNGNQDTLLVNFHVADNPSKEYTLGGALRKTHTELALPGETEGGLVQGQQDMVTGDVWIAGFGWSWNWGMGHYKLAADDTVTHYNPWWSGFFDVASPAPEPATLALLGVGLLALRRRRSA